MAVVRREAEPVAHPPLAGGRVDGEEVEVAEVDRQGPAQGTKGDCSGQLRGMVWIPQEPRPIFRLLRPCAEQAMPRRLEPPWPEEAPNCHASTIRSSTNWNPSTGAHVLFIWPVWPLQQAGDLSARLPWLPARPTPIPRSRK